MEFMHGHGQFSNELYNIIKNECSDYELKHGSVSTRCRSQLNKMYEEIGGYYAYNLYDDCTNNIYLNNQPADEDYENLCLYTLLYIDNVLVRGALNDYACPGNALNIWINRTDVREALNVPVDSHFFNGDNGSDFLNLS